MAIIMKKILTAVLSLAMVACFVPQTGMQAYAVEGDPAPPASMAMGSDALSKDAGKNGAQTVWYAGSAWRVIGYNGGGVASTEGDMTLLASDNLKTGVKFNTIDKYDNDYEGSNLKGVIDDLYKDGFSSGEKAAVKNRTLEVGEHSYLQPPYSTGVSGTATSGYLWPLSTEEALVMFDDSEAEELLNADDDWWLRSPGVDDIYSAFVYGFGNVSFIGSSVDIEGGVRPAFNLDLNSVLFTSAAAGGKSSGAAGADALTEVGTNSGSEWKLTLKSGHDDFEITECAPTANGVSVKYKGAITWTADKPEYISAIITDKPVTDSTATIKYYGRIAEASGDDDASVTINTAGKLEDGDTLYVFNEQYNGDKKTDYASALQEVTVPPAPGITLGPDVLSLGSNTSGAAAVHMAGTKWRVIGYGESTDEDSQVASSANTMTLIADNRLKEYVPFREGGGANHYGSSNLKYEIEKLTDADTDTEKIFSDEEKEGIVPRDLENGDYTDDRPYTNGIAGDEVTGALLWPLSSQEAYYMNAGLRRAGHAWWLRSPGNRDDLAASVYEDGTVNKIGDYAGGTNDLRPAFNYNLKYVLFTSAAEGGKSSGAAGALNEVGTNGGSEWKLTLESGHDSFKVDDVSTCDGKTVNIKYSGAVAKKGEYISAIIADEDDAVKYYGNLIEFADGDSTRDTAKVTIDGKMESTDKLYVFNEQLNGDKKTDYSSALHIIEIPSPPGHKYGPWAKINATQHQKVCEYDETHVVKENHKWDAGKVTKKATEKQAGVKTYTCTVCKATTTETIPKLKPQPKPQPKPAIDKAAAKIALDSGTKAISSGSKVTASWGAVKGASSYVIYANYCDQKKLKKIKTVSGKTTSFDITKLNGKKFNPKKNLKFYVVAYKTVKGKKVKLAKSIMAHAPGSKNSKRTNVTGVKVKKASFTLKKGKTAKIKAKLVLQKKGKKPLKHCAKFRYASSNKKVAKVSKKGKITAVGKGKCTVYVYAVSGVSKKIKVTVK